MKDCPTASFKNRALDEQRARAQHTDMALFGENTYRLATSFATTPQEIETFLKHCAAG